MSIFKKTALTKAGMALIAKTQTNRSAIKFTKAETGSGTWSLDEELIETSSIRDKKQQFAFSGIDIPDGNPSTVVVTVTINNKGLTELYYVTEMGIYAMDPDDGEVMYAICVTDEKQNYMPAENGVGTSNIVERLTIEVSNSANTIIMSEGGLVPATDFLALKKLVTLIDAAFTAGLPGQIPKKISSENYDVEWENPKKDVVTLPASKFPEAGEMDAIYVDPDDSSIYIWKNGAYFKLPLGAEAAQTLQKQITENLNRITKLEGRTDRLEARFDELKIMALGTAWTETQDEGIRTFSQEIAAEGVTEETDGQAWPWITSTAAGDIVAEQKAQAVFFANGRVFTEEGKIVLKCYKKAPVGNFGLLIQGEKEAATSGT